MKHGTEQNRPASDPYFFPVYEATGNLDMPICMHAGSGDPTGVSPVNPRLHAISACLDLVGAGIPEQFTDLRAGWIECGASWIPFVWQDIVARDRAKSWGSAIRKTAGRTTIDIGPDLFRRFRFYSSCETTDDLDYILGFGTEDSLLLGTDYAHSDQSAEMRVHEVIERRVTDGALSADVARKLLFDNARRFYGLP
jgi:predicted TIM-barrel fold metal-dependent hydrolase